LNEKPKPEDDKEQAIHHHHHHHHQRHHSVSKSVINIANDRESRKTGDLFDDYEEWLSEEDYTPVGSMREHYFFNHPSTKVSKMSQRTGTKTYSMLRKTASQHSQVKNLEHTEDTEESEIFTASSSASSETSSIRTKLKTKVRTLTFSYLNLCWGKVFVIISHT